jgi:hypothetical protein
MTFPPDPMMWISVYFTLSIGHVFEVCKKKVTLTSIEYIIG